jgi:hypothetical protein
MTLTLIATPTAANANSYETVAEAQDYFDSRLPLAGWDDADSQAVLLVMGTRVLDAMAVPRTRFVADGAYYITSRQWTGAPSTATQRLAWPRTGMTNRNGFVIPSGEIPFELKEALSELAGQLGTADTTLDNDVIVQGITSIKAGSVSLSFKDGIEAHVLPDAVMNLMPSSWFTEEVIDYALAEAEFDVI